LDVSGIALRAYSPSARIDSRVYILKKKSGGRGERDGDNTLAVSNEKGTPGGVRREGKELRDEGSGKKLWRTGPSFDTGFYDAAGGMGSEDALDDFGRETGLVTGAEKIEIGCGVLQGGFQGITDAHLLSQLGVRVVDDGNGEIGGEGSDFRTGTHEENAANGPGSVKACHQIQGVAG
jgi:hypothetical protein